GLRAFVGVRSVGKPHGMHWCGEFSFSKLRQNVRRELAPPNQARQHTCAYISTSFVVSRLWVFMLTMSLRDDTGRRDTAPVGKMAPRCEKITRPGPLQGDGEEKTRRQCAVMQQTRR
ncbi:unnamed protein product, partial [Ectocarpus sp. 12 AP-2014]